MRVAIIGAGLAGAACARALKAHGFDIEIFDKGRGAGGRLSTRRTDVSGTSVRFDHGAQFVTADHESFRAFLTDAETAGHAAIWPGRLLSIDRHGNKDVLRPRDRFVGVGGMNQIAKYALAPMDVHFSTRANRIMRSGDQWTIEFDEAEPQRAFDRVVLTLPPEQLIEFLARSEGDFSDIIYQARHSVVRPCWTVMAVLEDAFDPGFDGAKIYGGAIRWMARMASRPGQSDTEAIIIQASPDWSETFLEDEPDNIVRMLCEEAYVRFGIPTPAWSSAHRWRFAMVEEPASTPCALDETGHVGVAGDWRIDGRAEAAWISGEAVAQALINA